MLPDRVENGYKTVVLKKCLPFFSFATVVLRSDRVQLNLGERWQVDRPPCLLDRHLIYDILSNVKTFATHPSVMTHY